MSIYVCVIANIASAIALLDIPNDNSISLPYFVHVQHRVIIPIPKETPRCTCTHTHTHTYIPMHTHTHTHTGVCHV